VRKSGQEGVAGLIYFVLDEEDFIVYLGEVVEGLV
jgi:hypothetical protein